MRDAGDATFRGTFRKVTRTFRGRFADVLAFAGFTQGINYARSHTFHSVSRRFAGVSRVSRQLLRMFRARFTVFHGCFASVALDASRMQPRCHNVGISTQHDSINILVLNLKHSVTIQLSVSMFASAIHA